METRKIRPIDIKFLDVLKYLSNDYLPSVRVERNKIVNTALYDLNTNLLYPVFCPIDISFIYGSACLICPLCNNPNSNKRGNIGITECGPSTRVENMHVMYVYCNYDVDLFIGSSRNYHVFPRGEIIPPDDILDLRGILDYYDLTRWKLDSDILGEYLYRLRDVIMKRKETAEE